MSKIYWSLTFFSIIVLFPVVSFSQQNNWIVYNKFNSPLPSNRIEAVAIAGDKSVWLGTDSGLVRFNGTVWNVFDTVNSKLPSSFISALLADNNNIWAGTTNGLAVFDGSEWIFPPWQDSLFTSKNIISLTKDKQGNIWAAGELAVVKFPAGSFNGFREMEAIGSFLSITVDNKGIIWVGDFNYASHNGLLWEYDQSFWSYHKLNDYSELISSFPYSLVADKNNNIWMGFGGTVGGGVVKISNLGWQIFKEDNSDFPGGVPSSFVIQDTLIWMGGSEGLILFDGYKWSILNNLNSGLPGNWIRDLTIDGNGNKWIGTISDGVAVYNENGIVTSVKPGEKFPSEFALTNYPNPFNPQTTIIYELPEYSHVAINIYNISGENVRSLYTGKQNKGSNKIIFNANELPSGVYFCRVTASGINSGNIYQEVLKIMYLK